MGFLEMHNSKVKRQRSEKETGMHPGPPADDHDSLMRRESYQNIFKTLQNEPLNGTDALAAVAVAAMAESNGGALRQPMTSGAPATHRRHAAYHTPAAPHSSTPLMQPTATTSLLQAAAMAQAARVSEASVVGQGNAVSAKAAKPKPGPIVQTTMSPQMRMQMQGLMHQQQYMPSPTSASPGMHTPISPGTPVTPMNQDQAKKASRLWKNRLAAKECRRKKKEYVKDLEEKVKLLEAKNEDLMKQLRAARASLTASERESLKKDTTNGARQPPPVVVVTEPKKVVGSAVGIAPPKTDGATVNSQQTLVSNGTAVAVSKPVKEEGVGGQPDPQAPSINGTILSTAPTSLTTNPDKSTPGK